MIVNRRKRKGIPEVIFAETKELDEIKKITKKTLEKTNSVIISRIKKEDYSKIMTFAKRLKIKIKTGKNSSSILLFKKPIKISWWKSWNNYCWNIRCRSGRRIKADV